MDRDKITTKELLIQSLATSIISFLACQTGFVMAWPSYTVATFLSNATVLSRPMSSLEISLLGSLPNIGGLITSPLCGYAFNTFGRKYATMMCGIPFMLGWVMILMTSSVPVVLLAVCIAGVGIAGQNVSLIYISEISHDSVRGGLTACSSSGYFLGILISYIMGGYLSYMQVLYAHLSLAVLVVVLIMFLPESPVFLVLVGKEEEAAKSIAFYRQIDIKSKAVEAEISKIKLQLDPRLEKILEGENDLQVIDELLEKNVESQDQKQNESAWQFFKKSKSSQRALRTVLVVMGSTVLMGCVVLQVYAEPLFAEAVPAMPANQCAIFLAIDFLVASLLCVLAIDRYGRKSLMLVTSGGSGICTVLLGVQLQFHVWPAWCTVLFIYAFCFIFTLGGAVIPFVLAAEVFLPEVRSFCNSVVMACTWIFMFTTLVVFNPLVAWLGLGPVFYLFSVVCFLSLIYTLFCLPETKGLPADEIQALFLKKKKDVKK